MALNPYFNQTTFATEQSLVADFVEEAIQIHGLNVYYIPREDANLDHLFGEDPLAYYANAIQIEMYVKNYQSFAGQSDFISKFGLQIEDQITLVMSARRFYQVFTEMRRPRENDLIYIQLSAPYADAISPARYVFQINFVQSQEQFFPLGKLQTIELRCELMTHSHERIQTGIPDLDAVAQQKAYTVDVVMQSGSGTYEYEEFVYQGRSLVQSLASGTVVNWNADTMTLSVQTITGTFVPGQPVVGVQSSATYLPVAAAVDTSPTVKDPISDNTIIDTEGGDIVINRGNNPRFI
jgi:hypothetical protein